MIPTCFDIGRCHRRVPEFLLSCFSLPVRVMVRVGSTHQRQGNSETWQCLYGGSGNDLHFTWKEALDNWVEYKKPCNTASGRTGLGEPSQEEFGTEGVRTHLCPKAPATFKLYRHSGAASDMHSNRCRSSLPAGMGGSGNPCSSSAGSRGLGGLTAKTQQCLHQPPGCAAS